MQNISMVIVEYLDLMRDAQAECKLSEKEFKSMLMTSTTGEPHVLIRDWLAHDEDFFLQFITTSLRFISK